MKIDTLQRALNEHGLHVLELVQLSETDSVFFDFDIGQFKSIALVGNKGSSYWPVFERSSEYRDKQPNPLDRWSRRVGEAMAEKVAGKIIFPFGGPPFYPFQQWAGRAGSLQRSVLGLMIHPEYGLWHSYRFGVLLRSSEGASASQHNQQTTVCQSCTSQPCLNHCPAEAFTKDGYEIQACVNFLRENPAATCHTQGCQARLACPVGDSYTYQSVQNRFHLKAFLDSRK